MKTFKLVSVLIFTLTFLQQSFSQERIENGIIDQNTPGITLTPFQGYTETAPVYGQLQYRIFYHRTNGIPQNFLLKPVIISDGFDPLDSRKIQAIDFTDTKHPHDVCTNKSIEDVMNYIDCNNQQQNLLHILTGLGYDVIIVNYPEYTASNGQKIDGGADYIERNAMNMIGLIQKINELVNNSEQLVIVGPSMGGQITRYALAYMEKMYAQTGNAIWKHNTRLWISIDSPHLGANIPVSAQSLVYQLIPHDKSGGASNFYYNWLRSNAAKQQLIDFYNPNTLYYLNSSVTTTDPDPTTLNGRTISQGFSYDHGSQFFRYYYSGLFNNGLQGSKGYPMNLRKIALVNGSLSGKTSTTLIDCNGNKSTGNYGTPSSQVLNLRGFSLGGGVLVAAIEGYNMPAYNQTSKITRLKYGLDGFGGSDNLYTTSNPNSRGSLDVVPGGHFPAWQLLTSTITGTPQYAFDISNYWILDFDFTSKVDWDIDVNNMVHSFIPSFSALGIKNPDQDWSQPLNNRNLVCTGETPFDSYFGHDDNTQHTSFDCESVKWLLKELAGNPQDPWYPVNANDLIGDNIVCIGNTATYNFANSCKVPSNVTAWNTSAHFQIINSTGLSVTVQALETGDGTITATFSNGCTMTKKIHAGTTTGNIPILGYAASVDDCAGTMFNVYVDGDGSYNWTVIGGQIVSGQGTPEVYVRLNNTPGSYFYIGVAENNQCGSSGDLGAIGGGIVFCDNGGPANTTGVINKKDSLHISMDETLNIPNKVLLYPNPVKDILKIAVTENELGNLAQIFDANNSLLKTIKLNDYQTSVNVVNFSAGVYFVRINSKSGIKTLKFVKE